MNNYNTNTLGLLQEVGINYTFDENLAEELGYKRIEFKSYYKELEPGIFTKVFDRYVYCRHRSDFLILMDHWNQQNPKMWKFF